MRLHVRIPHLIAAEFRRLVSTPMAVLALVALLTVPVLYGGLYLWANQDPYGSLANVPVALVVNDDGAELNGEQRNLGEEVAQQLVASATFGWDEVDAATAASGLDQGTYDFSIEIPAGFTAAIASIATSSPRQADIQLRTNDANNYLASTIGTQAVARIQATVTQTVVSEAGLALLDALQTIRAQLQDAANGASRLADGLGQAEAGGQQLADGTSQLADGTAQLADGTAQVASGSAQLADGGSALADGASRVAGGTAQLAGIAERVAAASSSVVGALPAARTDIARALADAGLDPAQVDAILARLDQAADDVVAVNGDVQNAAGQIETLNDGAQQVAAGAASLAGGASDLASGASQTAAGARQVSDGAAQAEAGASQLAGALGQLSAGSQQLQTGLANGVNSIPEADDALRQAQANTLGDPVTVDASALATAQNYGAGLAPFFAALAGWIGIYALFLIVKPVSRRAVTALRSPIRVTVAGWATPALLGGVQVTALFGVLAIALGFSFVHPLATWGVLLLATATYASIVLALNVWLGSVGQFLGLVLMVLQLVTAGGTFPWQTLPGPLAALHHVLPMGFVVDAMRQVMYGGSIDRVWPDLAVLAAWLLVALVLTVLGVARLTRHRTLRDLQPSLIG